MSIKFTNSPPYDPAAAQHPDHSAGNRASTWPRLNASRSSQKSSPLKTETKPSVFSKRGTSPSEIGKRKHELSEISARIEILKKRPSTASKSNPSQSPQKSSPLKPAPGPSVGRERQKSPSEIGKFEHELSEINDILAKRKSLNVAQPPVEKKTSPTTPTDSSRSAPPNTQVALQPQGRKDQKSTISSAANSDCATPAQQSQSAKPDTQRTPNSCAHPRTQPDSEGSKIRYANPAEITVPDSEARREKLSNLAKYMLEKKHATMQAREEKKIEERVQRKIRNTKYYEQLAEYERSRKQIELSSLPRGARQGNSAPPVGANGKRLKNVDRENLLKSLEQDFSEYQKATDAKIKKIVKNKVDKAREVWERNNAREWKDLLSSLKQRKP